MTGFPVNNSTLSPEALVDRVLSRYGLSAQAKCHFLQRGVNDTYIVKAGRSTHYLRVYTHGWRTRSEIEAEMDMLSYLHRRGHPVSRPIRRKDRSYLTRIGAPEGVRYAALFTGAPGQEVEMNVNQTCSYGKLAGRIHRMPG
jgi:Ser/Thr protein kinase RdoA (MazF antagonist)